MSRLSDCRRHRRSCRPRRASTDGSVAAGFALVAPLIILIAAEIIDFGMLATKSAGMAATTRIGAQYARVHPIDTSGIQNAMQSAMSFAPALTFPRAFRSAASVVTRHRSRAPRFLRHRRSPWP